MSPSNDIPQFLELWQSTLQEATILGCIFSEPQQVNLFLGALPVTWSAIITTQGGISGLTFIDLFSNTLQQNDINNSTVSKSTSSSNHALYVKGKYIKPSYGKPSKIYNPGRFQKPFFHD